MTITTMATKEELRRELPHVLGASRQSAVRGTVLADRFGYRDDRTIRAVIRELIADGLPVASETTPPAGFFIATTQEEVMAYAKALRDRLIEDAKRRRDFLRAAKAVRYPGQLPLI